MDVSLPVVFSVLILLWKIYWILLFCRQNGYYSAEYQNNLASEPARLCILPQRLYLKKGSRKASIIKYFTTASGFNFRSKKKLT